MSMAIDKAGQLGDFDTITREQYRRINGVDPATDPVICLECPTPLTPVQIKRGGKFCSSRCGGIYNSRIPAKPKQETPVGIVHDLIGDEYDVTTGERNGHEWRPAAAAAPQLIVEILAQLAGLAGTAILHADRWEFEATIGDVTVALHKTAS